MGNESSTGKYNDLEAMKKYSCFSPGQVDIIREKFDLMADEDLTISKEQFGKLMKIPSKEIDRIFEYFDTDSSGKIDSYEFVSALALLSQATLLKKAELIFNLYDFDKNKTITQNELVICLKTTMSALNSMCGKEETTIAQAETKAKDILAKYDTNKDGSVSLHEFQSFMSKDSDIIKMLTSYGLISKEDLRADFGGSSEIPEADSDLEEELDKMNADRDERIERIKNGIEHSYVTEEEKLAYEKQLSEDKMTNKEQKYWQKIISNTVRPDERAFKFDNSAPPVNMSIHHVYGYRCYDTRNNIKINSQKSIVYHVAALGIVQKQGGSSQSFYQEHTDDITCLDINGNTVVTGQLGANPLLCVWDSISLESKAIFKGVLRNGISNVAISSDGKKVAAVSLESESSVVFYDVDKATLQRNFSQPKKGSGDGLIATGKLTDKPVFDIRFDKAGKILIAACMNDILFVTYESGIAKVAKGVWSQSNPPQSCLSIGLIDNNLVTGMFKGSLYLWKNSKFHSAVQAHTGPVTAIHSREGEKKGIITAGRDGFIFIWDSQLKISQKVDVKNLKLYSSRIVAVAEDDTQEQLIFGTRGSEIVEYNFSSNRHKVVCNGHWEGELYGLATQPQSSYFYTVGEDTMLACWNIERCILSQSTKLDFPAKCIDLAASGKYLAVGCLNGTVLIVDPKSLVVIFSLKDRDRAVTCLKFSPDGETMVVAYAEPSCELLVYDSKNHFKQTAKIRGSTTPVTHIDFSNDSRKIIQCNNAGCELLFFDLVEKNKAGAVGKQILDYKLIYDVKWKTQTCIYGYNVQGIWPPCSNGGDINTIDQATTVNVIVTGDDFSKVKAFRYPCTNVNQSFNKYSGHASHVSKIKFVLNDQYVVSVGGAEKSIIQWKFEYDIAAQEQQADLNQAESKDSNNQEQEEEQDNGDQSGAIKPYLGQLMLSVPEQYRTIEEKKFNILPSAQLGLNHVFGFKCKTSTGDARNLLKFLPNQKIVYPAAGVGVVLENKKDQSFFVKHEEEIVSLAVHPKANIVATGQVAPKAKANLIDIFIWDADTKQILGQLNDFHTKAVTFLEFSPDGNFLLTIGDDSDHSLAVYDWQQSRMISNSKVDKAAVSAIIWRNSNEFVTCGAKHIKFWNVSGRNLTSKAGTGLNPFSQINCLALCANNGVVVSGTNDGRLVGWNGNVSSKAVQAHQKPIGSVVAMNAKQGSKETFVFSGGYDGRILRWKVDANNIVQENSFLLDLNVLQSKFIDHGVISLAVDAKQDQFLIGTRSGEIFTNKIGMNAEKIQDSHFEGELWGCAVDPKSLRFATSGGDKTIRIWDISSQKIEHCTEQLPNDVRALDWAPSSGNMIVAGDTFGQIILFDTQLNKLAQQTSKFTKQTNAKKLINWIEDIKFSPNEKYVAFGAHGGPSTIEIFEIKDGKDGSSKSIDYFASINAGLTQSLTHLDWNVGSDKIVANSEAYELKFISLNQKKDVASSTCSEEDWSTWTCTLGWFVKGIFPGADGIDVNSCVCSSNKKVIATGDDFGKVNLFTYPACAPRQSRQTYLGHSAHVTRVKFTSDDRFLISTGGSDKTILVWNVEGVAGQEEDKKQTSSKLAYSEFVDEIDDDDIGIVKKKEKKDKFGKQPAAKQQLQAESDDIFGAEDADKGDEFMAVKPWLGALKEPSNYYKDALNQSKEPPVSLSLDFVHGYRAKDCRDNIRYLKSGSIVYNAAALGIIMDIPTNTQRYFQGHNDDITAMDVHPDGVRVATGQIGAKPSIYVWDSNTLLPLCFFKGNLKNGIAALAFTPSGDKLAAVAIDTNHEIALYDINAKSKTGGVQILLEKSGPDVVTSIKWRNEIEFATAGVKHFKLWNAASTSLKGTKGSWDKSTCSNILLTINTNGDDYLCGAMDGSLQVFKGSSLASFKKLHDKAIDTIFVQSSTIFTGGRDYKVLVLDKSYNVIAKILLEEVLRGPNMPSQCPEVRAVGVSYDMKNIILGTYASEIYELTTKDAKISATTKFTAPKSVVKGHYTPNKKQTNEIWGLSTSPLNEDHFYTASDDGTLRQWSISQRKQEKCIKTNQDASGVEVAVNSQTGDLADSVQGRCVGVSCDGFVGVGFKDGTIRLYDPNLNQQAITKQAKEWISDLKFSPDGSVIAAGSHDNAIYILQAVDLKQKIRPLKKHSSYITHLDFSLDGNNLHSNCGAYELLFWDINSGKQITSGATQFRDEPWSTWTATLGWPVQGIWPEGADGTDINAVDRSNGSYSGVDTPPDNYFLLATCDDDSQVKIFRYPCIKKGSKALIGKGHSSHVTNVKFSKQDDYLITTGGEDNCVFQWKVQKKK